MQQESLTALVSHHLEAASGKPRAVGAPTPSTEDTSTPSARPSSPCAPARSWTSTGALGKRPFRSSTVG